MSTSDLSIIKALKKGRVPRVGSLELAVGRDVEIAEFRRSIDYVCSGFSEVRFLRGDYGTGKTFMCSVLREIAFSKLLAVSIVNLSREVPFGRRELVLSEILLGLRTKESGAEPALASIIERWFEKYDAGVALEENAALADAIHTVSSADPQLASALRGYYRAYLDGNGSLMEAALDFMRGATITSESRSALKLAGRLTPDASLRRLRAIIALMRDAGLPGLLILVDEAETIRRLNKVQRDAAYVAIREIVDTCEEAFPYCLFVFAGTQELFEDEFNGVASYQPLYQRIKNTQVTNARDVRQPIIRLEELGKDALLAVSKRVRDLHGKAYAWDARARFTDNQLAEFTATVGSKFGDIRQKPRGFLKALTDVLDATEQGVTAPGADAILETIDRIEKTDTSLASTDDDIVVAVA
jgi:adenosylhomocysteinase